MQVDFQTMTQTLENGMWEIKPVNPPGWEFPENWDTDWSMDVRVEISADGNEDVLQRTFCVWDENGELIMFVYHALATELEDFFDDYEAGDAYQGKIAIREDHRSKGLGINLWRFGEYNLLLHGDDTTPRRVIMDMSGKDWTRNHTSDLIEWLESLNRFNVEIVYEIDEPGMYVIVYSAKHIQS